MSLYNAAIWPFSNLVDALVAGAATVLLVTAVAAWAGWRRGGKDIAQRSGTEAP